MELYLAGGWTGNTGAVFRNYVEGHSLEKSMELFLAGNHTIKNGSASTWTELNILESYYYARTNKYIPKLIPTAQNFLLDSGAFTFMQQGGGNVDWDRYANEYADYINKYDVKLFFELDIDSIVGIKAVERIRSLIERRTNKKVIPVWHVERGKQYFLDMCKDYDYVSLGSIAKVTPGKVRIKPEYFPWFCTTAKKNGCRIHALGYTPKNLKDCGFSSVDSTNWLHGNIGGYVYQFNSATGEMGKVEKPSNCLLKSRAVAAHNYNEWVKYMKFLRTI